MPAITIAAEWSNDEVGVGAVIQSVNQPEKGNWADLVKAAIMNEKDTD